MQTTARPPVGLVRGGLGRQPWLHSAGFDGMLVLAPPLLAVAVALLLPEPLRAGPVTLGAWVALVLAIDVAHVWASLYRTYLVPGAVQRHSLLLLGVPALCWIVGVLTYTAGPGAFWRMLAYVAVFHFVRQQYGFLRLYARAEGLGRWRRALDAATIYLATLYPLVVWHVEGRGFEWFVVGDFIELPLPGLPLGVGIAYAGVLAAYITVHLADAWRGKGLNLPKHLVVLGTAAAWYVGIVWLEGDLTFTLTNVVAHGVPYLGLVWLTSRRDYARAKQPLPQWLRSAGVFVALLLLLAFVEEWTWDAAVWQARPTLFPTLPEGWRPAMAAAAAVVVPTLALPQFAHYVLDAFIWRRTFDPFTADPVAAAADAPTAP